MLGSRVSTAAVLICLFTAALFYAPPSIWLALCVLALVIAAWEWGRLAKLPAVENGAFSLALALGTLALGASSTGRSWLVPAYGLAMVFWLGIVPIWLWRRPSVRHQGVLAATGVFVLAPPFAALMQLRDVAAGWLLAVMGLVWISDAAAFLVGRRFGRHKLAPEISPGKTWEGLFGALAAVLVYAVAALWLAPEVLPGGPWTDAGAAWVALALAFALLGVIGDLFESQMKRGAGQKDSGRLLPGHGGVLDRIDALMPVLPAAAWIFGQ